jgi:hypothetical protein
MHVCFGSLPQDFLCLVCQDVLVEFGNEVITKRFCDLAVNTFLLPLSDILILQLHRYLICDKRHHLFVHNKDSRAFTH